MEPAIAELEERAKAAKAASRRLALLSTEVKNRALHNMAEGLKAREDLILKANAQDMKEARASGMDEAMQDRLLLNPARLADIAGGVRAVAALSDPVGEVLEMRTLPNGLIVGRKRVPLGVIGTIYESRPNVTVDIATLCLKSGNAVILRGGREAQHSNAALAGMLVEAAVEAGVPGGAVTFIESPERALVAHMLQMKGTIDLIIPRGGEGLIRFVTETSAVPVVAGGIGVCHTFVDSSADLDMAVAIAYNAKVQRPTVCNALDTILVHRDVAVRFLPALALEWAKGGVEVHADPQALKILEGAADIVKKGATDDDWGREFLSLVAAIKVVDSLDAALAHIERYGSGHSEAIITEDYSAAQRFLNEVDAACVYVNASTRFTDGGQFGLGAEVGISTQKLHARGPMGLKELTSYKWVIYGQGQVRPG